MKYQFLGVVTSNKVESRTANVNPPETKKIKEARGFSSYLLAGNDPGSSRVVWRPIYHKGEAAIVDGYYASDMPAWIDTGSPNQGD